MVPCNHNGADARGDAVGHRLLGLRPGGVHHGDQTQEEHVVLLLQGDLRGLQPPAGKGQYPKALVGKGLIDPLDLLPFPGPQHRPVQHHVHRALGHQHIAAGKPMDRGHELPVRVKGQFAQPGPLVPDIQLIKAKVLSQADQSGLRGVPDLPFLIHCGVAAQQSRPEKGLLHRVLEVGLLSGYDPPAHIELPDGHLVLGQGASLIRADHRHTPQPFHRLELPDHRVLLGHLPGAEGEDNGDNGAQRLRDGRHCQGHSEEESAHHIFPAEQNTHSKQKAAQDQNADGEFFAKLIQAHLEGGLLLRGGLQQGRNLAHLGVHPCAGDQKPAPAIGDKGAREHHILPVSQGNLPVNDLCGLLHRQALPGQGALGGLQAGTFQQAAVGTDGVACLQHHDIPRDNLPAGNLDHCTIPQNLRRGGRHLFQAVQGGLRLHRLDRAQNRVHGDHRQDDHRTLHISQHGGDHRGQDQNDHQKVRELLQKNPKCGFFSPFPQLIGAVPLQPPGGLVAGQAARAAFQGVQQVLAGPLPDLIGCFHAFFFLSVPRQPGHAKKTSPFAPTPSRMDSKVSPFQTEAGPFGPCIDAAAPQSLVPATPFFYGASYPILQGLSRGIPGLSPGKGPSPPGPPPAKTLAILPRMQ